jgi:hypothetical protein
MRIAAPFLLGFPILAGLAGLLWAHAGETRPLPGTSIGNGTSAGSPSAVIDKTVWNFGTVPTGEELNATFSIKNNGSKRLILSDQSQCCGSADQDVIIPPGKTKDIKFLIPTINRELGPQRKLVCYETNDRLNPTLVFTMVFDLTEH